MMVLAVLAVVLPLASPPLAVADPDGTVLVYEAGRAEWLAVDRCPRAPVSLAWVGERLFIACPGRPLASWRPSRRGSRPLEGAVARLRPDLIAGAADLFILERGVLWRYRVAFDMLERIAAAPGPVRWIRATPAGLMVGDRGAWLWRRRRWEAVTDDFKNVRPANDSDTVQR